jgi:integrase
MAKPPKLPHVRYVFAKGKVYAYFNSGRKKDGRAVYVPLPKPGTPGFFDSYIACKAARERAPAKAYTAATLFDEYQSSPDFAKLAAGTRKSYGIYLRLAAELLGLTLVDRLSRSHIQMVLDNEKWGGAKRNLFVAVIGAAYKWGRGRDKTTIAPTRDIGRVETGERLPWPDDVLEAALAAECDLTRLGAALLFYTGQRIGDVCQMRWTAVRAGKIAVRQQKTDKPLKIAMHTDLCAELDRYGKRGLTLLTNAQGGPISPEALRQKLKAFCAECGHPGLLPHGLRKNAVIALLTAGCSVAETAAITGQTYQLVEYYARQIDQERLGEAAILKLERRTNTQTLAKTGQ